MEFTAMRNDTRDRVVNHNDTPKYDNRDRAFNQNDAPRFKRETTDKGNRTWQGRRFE